MSGLLAFLIGAIDRKQNHGRTSISVLFYTTETTWVVLVGGFHAYDEHGRLDPSRPNPARPSVLSSTVWMALLLCAG